MDLAGMRGTSFGAYTCMEMAAGTQVLEIEILRVEISGLWSHRNDARRLGRIIQDTISLFSSKAFHRCCATSFLGPGPCIFVIPLWGQFLESVWIRKRELGRISWPHTWEHEFPLFFPIYTAPRAPFRLGFCLVKKFVILQLHVLRLCPIDQIKTATGTPTYHLYFIYIRNIQIAS